MKLKHDPIPNLLGTRQPAWVKYQTLVKILKRPEDDPEAIRWRKKRDSSAMVARICAKQARDGSFPCLPWMHIHKYYFHQMLEMGYGIDDITVKTCCHQSSGLSTTGRGLHAPQGPGGECPGP